MLFKWKRLARHLEKKGVRAPATVVEIAKTGHEVETQGFEGVHAARDAVTGGAGTTLAPDSSLYIVRKARLRIQPAEGEEFEVEQDFRFGDYGREVPAAGDELDVVYDPDDRQKVLIAPPTAEEEALRTAEALSKADIGITIGGGGNKPGGGKPVTKEELDERVGSMDESMDQAQSMLEQAQQFMSGEAKPGSKKGKKK